MLQNQSSNSSSGFSILGYFTPGQQGLALGGPELIAAVERIREPAYIVRDACTGQVGVAFGGRAGAITGQAAEGSRVETLAVLPALYPEWLGDRAFLEAHSVRFPYVAGEMANRITTEDMVIAMARAKMLGFFGAGGLHPDRVAAAMSTIHAALDATGESWGTNLIHSPQEPELEEVMVDLYLKHDVRRVSASAFMALRPSIVRYACSGLAVDAQGNIIRRNHVFAKISRPEVAQPFMEPAPAAMLAALVSAGKLTAGEARLAARVPIAQDITVEADSGGHTDNRPLVALMPTIVALRDALMRRHGFAEPIRVGAAGGIATPASVAASFAMGAAFVLTGSINQPAVESGLSPAGKQMLTHAGIADIIMAPAGDMFEQGVQVQVLKRGTMFAPRARRLYELYQANESLESIPAQDVEVLERDFFQKPIRQVWAETEKFFQVRDPSQLERAARDPKHKMALVFRWYLGQSSRWAISGDPARTLDFQIWCGPAMGAFNAWAAGSFLEPLGARTVAQIALNLMEGAAVLTRAQQLRSYGVPVPAAAFDFRPRPLQ